MATRTADAPHTADRAPTDDESALADRQTEDLEASGEEAEAAEHFKEMTKIGVEQEGEGKIE